MFFICEIGYLLIPEFGKKHIELIDYDKVKGGAISLTGMLSYACLFLIVVLQIQKFNQDVDSEDRLHLSAEERGFRYRQKFMTEISIYVCTLILSVFLTLNHLMSVNRKRKHYKEEYEKLMGQPKNKDDKKKD